MWAKNAAMRSNATPGALQGHVRSGWCHWRHEYGSLCSLTLSKPLCLRQRSEMFAHMWFYQTRSNTHPGNPCELPSKMHFLSEKNATIQNQQFFSKKICPYKKNNLLSNSINLE